MAAMEEKAQHEPQDCCSRMGFRTLGTARQSTSGPRWGEAFTTSVFSVSVSVSVGVSVESGEEDGDGELSSFRVDFKMNEESLVSGLEFVR